MVLSQLPAVEQRSVVVHCQPGAMSEPDRHGRPLLLFQSPGNPNWELAAPGRTPMVEVIQKAPRPSNNNNSATAPPTTHLSPPCLPLPTLHEEQGEVEITLTPVELHVSSPPPPPTSSAVSSSPATMIKNEEDQAESSTSSQREGN